VVLPLYARDSTMLTVLIDHCTRGSTLYTLDSTILTVLIDNINTVRMVEPRV
jgi:hypothetical protein